MGCDQVTILAELVMVLFAPMVTHALHGSPAFDHSVRLSQVSVFVLDESMYHILPLLAVVIRWLYYRLPALLHQLRWYFRIYTV